MLAHWGFFIGRLKALILRCASLTWAVKQHSLLLPHHESVGWDWRTWQSRALRHSNELPLGFGAGPSPSTSFNEKASMLAHWGFFIGRLKALILRCASLTWAVKQHSLLVPHHESVGWRCPFHCLLKKGAKKRTLEPLFTTDLRRLIRLFTEPTYATINIKSKRY